MGWFSKLFKNKKPEVPPTPKIIIKPPTTPPIVISNWLKVVGNKIVDSAGNQVILKGLNIADPEQLDVKSWERPGFSASIIANKAIALGAKVIRLPILPGNSSYPKEGFLNKLNGYDIYFNYHILPLVKELTGKGIFVIIDLHYVQDYNTLSDKVTEFWTYMAPKFNTNPLVLYEIFNEPINPDNWTTWKNLAQPTVDLIRKFAPNNLILVGGPYWSSHISGAVSNPIEGSNIVYVAHIYSNQPYSDLAKRYGEVIKKYPLFVTEWGFEYGGTEGGDIVWGQDIANWLSYNNVSWTVWCYDTQWGPRMVDDKWNLRPSPGGMGMFVSELLK